jgi:hypothetical protein
MHLNMRFSISHREVTLSNEQFFENQVHILGLLLKPNKYNQSSYS